MVKCTKPLVPVICIEIAAQLIVYFSSANWNTLKVGDGE